MRAAFLLLGLLLAPSSGNALAVIAPPVDIVDTHPSTSRTLPRNPAIFLVNNGQDVGAAQISAFVDDLPLEDFDFSVVRPADLGLVRFNALPSGSTLRLEIPGGFDNDIISSFEFRVGDSEDLSTPEITATARSQETEKFIGTPTSPPSASIRVDFDIQSSDDTGLLALLTFETVSADVARLIDADPASDDQLPILVRVDRDFQLTEPTTRCFHFVAVDVGGNEMSTQPHCVDVEPFGFSGGCRAVGGAPGNRHPEIAVLAVCLFVYSRRRRLGSPIRWTSQAPRPPTSLGR